MSFDKENEKFNFYTLIASMVLCLGGLWLAFKDQMMLKEAMRTGALKCSELVCEITSASVMELFTPAVWINTFTFMGLMGIVGTILFTPHLIEKEGIEIPIFGILIFIIVMLMI